VRGDFSRITFLPGRHYSGVLLQQGRVLVDADFNEHEEIERYRLRMLARDLIGACGGPGDGAGFEITVDGSGQAVVGAGRYYVDGLLVENEKSVVLPAPESGPGRYLVYLDAWEASVSALDDPPLRDPAVEGADTSLRLRVVSQIVIVPADAVLAIDESRPTLDVRTGDSGYTGPENTLYRVEIHDGGEARATFKWSRDNGSLVLPLTEIRSDELVAAKTAADELLRLNKGDWLELLDAELELEGRPGQLVQVTAVDVSARTVKVTPATDVGLGGVPRARRWHGVGAVPPEEGEAVALEEGIVLRFGGSGYRSGDYWVFSARAENGSVEWPGGPQQAGRVEHRYCPLGTLKLTKKGRWTLDRQTQKPPRG
jgi:hypothetical protein